MPEQNPWQYAQEQEVLAEADGRLPLRDPETHAIIGAAMAAHRELGPGFLEVVYQEALAVELGERQIPFKREVKLPVRYHGQLLACEYRVDFICYDQVIVELKATSGLTEIDYAQVVNYLKASRFTRALLFNFGTRSLQYKRFIQSHP
jgi:GxxExxY protein